MSRTAHERQPRRRPSPRAGVRPLSLRVRALESLLIEKGLVSSEAVDRIVSAYEQDIGPHNGARVVARAWVDPAFKARLLADGTAAIEELGFGGRRSAVVENTPERPQPGRLHALLLLPVGAARAAAHLVQDLRVPLARRHRAARGAARVRRWSCRAMEIRVWDSSAELRYMVLPERPAGTERADRGASWRSWSRATR